MTCPDLGMALATVVLIDVFTEGQWIPKWQFIFAMAGKFSERRWHLSWVLPYEWEFTIQRKEGRTLQEKK